MLRLLSALVTAGLSVAIVQTANAAGRGAELARQMQQTGKPALIIAGNEGCVYCRLMAQELATDRSIQHLVEQYLVLEINTDSADWPRLRDTFQFDESGIPAVFVVRADGELLYSKSGKPTDLAAFLKEYLESAGTILDPERLQSMRRAVTVADRSLKRGDYATLLPIVQEYAGSGSYAQVAQAMDAIQAKLIERVTSEANDAEKQMAARDHVLDAAMSLAELRRILADYEPAAEIEETVWSRLAENETHSALLEQATTLDRAACLAGEKKWSEAAELYESVATTTPETPAGRYASEHLEEVRARAKVASGADDEDRPTTSNPSGIADEHAAAAYLKFAKLYLERDAEKARGYLQRTIKAAPDSESAEEARGLLEQLDGEPD
jgi:tetratricopeptide (TPR) repeat protein